MLFSFLYMHSYVVNQQLIFADKYRSYGGQESSTIKIDPLLSGKMLIGLYVSNDDRCLLLTAPSTLPIQQLLEQLRWHQKQILAGMSLLRMYIYIYIYVQSWGN